MGLFLLFVMLCFTLPLLGVILYLIASYFKKSKGVNVKRNCIIVFAFVFNLQLAYYICSTEVESYYGLYDDNWEIMSVSNDYGQFENIDGLVFVKTNNMHFEPSFNYRIKECENNIVLFHDSVSYNIDNKGFSSLIDCDKDYLDSSIKASNYCSKEFWRIHNDNNLYVIKSVIALLIAFLVTFVEYRICRKIKH